MRASLILEELPSAIALSACLSSWAGENMLLAWPPPGLGPWDLLPRCLPLPVSHLPQRAETPNSPEKGPRLHLHPHAASRPASGMPAPSLQAEWMPERMVLGADQIFIRELMKPPASFSWTPPWDSLALPQAAHSAPAFQIRCSPGSQPEACWHLFPFWALKTLPSVIDWVITMK